MISLFFIGQSLALILFVFATHDIGLLARDSWRDWRAGFVGLGRFAVTATACCACLLLLVTFIVILVLTILNSLLS